MLQGKSVPHEYQDLHAIVLDTLKLLPDSFYRAKTFNGLNLGGRSLHHRHGHFDQETRVVTLSQRFSHLPLLGATYLLLHEIGHTIEDRIFGRYDLVRRSDRPAGEESGFAQNANVRLPAAYYQERDGCGEEASLVHNGLHNDLLMFFALATEQDIQRWYAIEETDSSGKTSLYVDPEEREVAESFREAIFGERRDHLPQLQHFVDQLVGMEEQRGFIYYAKPEFTERHTPVLTNLRRRIEHPDSLLQERYLTKIEQEGGRPVPVYYVFRGNETKGERFVMP